MRTHALAALLLVSTLTGCLGSVDPATLPPEALDTHGWSQQGSSSQSLVLGLGDLEIRDYGPGSGFAGATLASVNDVPLVSEEDRVLPRAIDRVEEKRGVEFTSPSTGSLELTNRGTTVEATEYDVEGADGPAKAVLFTPECGPFVIVAGYGTTATGLTGGAAPYDDARDVVKSVTC